MDPDQQASGETRRSGFDFCHLPIMHRSFVTTDSPPLQTWWWWWWGGGGGGGGRGGITGQMSHFLIFTCPHNAGEIRRNRYTKANMAVQCKTYQIAEETNLPSRQCKVIGGNCRRRVKSPCCFSVAVGYE